MRISKYIFLISLLSCIAYTGAEAREIYVDSQADIKLQDGSREYPYKT